MSSLPTAALSLSSNTAYRPMTVGDWIVTKLILMIPLAGLVMLFVWAFSEDTHPSKKTFCQALLIMFAALIGLALIGTLFFGGLIVAIGSHSPR